MMTWHSDKKGERINHFLLMGSLQTLGYVFILVSIVYDVSFALKFTALSVPHIFGRSLFALRTAYTSDIMPKEVAASGFAFINAFGSFGGFLGTLSS